MDRKEKIKRILREYQLKEEFTSTISGNLEVEPGTTGYYITIGRDLENNDKLTLFVGFTFNVMPEYDEFLYGLVVLDENNRHKTEIMTRKRQTNKVIPTDILNRGVLFPIVEEYTNKVIDRFDPNKILMRTDDTLTENFLKRLNIIIEIFLNKGYKMESDKENLGIRYIKLNKTPLNESDEEFLKLIEQLPSIDERNKQITLDISEDLRKIPNFINRISYSRGGYNITLLTESIKGKKINPNKMVYHKSNPVNRDSILRNGLYPSVGDCYKTHVGDENKCLPATFATNSDNKEEWFDTTWDNDVWAINTEIAGVNWFFDNNFKGFRHPEFKDYKHIVTFEKIPKEALELIYKGTGDDEN